MAPTIRIASNGTSAIEIARRGLFATSRVWALITLTGDLLFRRATPLISLSYHGIVRLSDPLPMSQRKIMVANIATAAVPIERVAAQVRTLLQGPLTCSPMNFLSEPNNTISTRRGGATTPLMTAV